MRIEFTRKFQENSHPRAFISFDYDNNSIDKTLFVGQIKNSLTPFNAQDWSSNTKLPQALWEQLPIEIEIEAPGYVTQLQVVTKTNVDVVLQSAFEL